MKAIMKFFLVLSLGSLVLCATDVFAQLNLPMVSPQAQVTQRIGITDITIKYHRPGVKGREVWGNLVPYGLAPNNFGTAKNMPWRAGANENTVITFSDDVPTVLNS